MLGPMSSSSVFGGMIGLVLIVAVLALMAGLALSGTDLLNPTSSDAAARAKNQITSNKERRDALDLEVYQVQKENEMTKSAADLEAYKAVQAARAKAEQKKAQLEVEALQHRMEQELELARLTRYVLLAIGTLITLIASAGAVVRLVLFSRSRWALAPAQVAHVDPWRDAEWRAQQVRRARENELAERGAAAVCRAVQEPAVSGNGKHSPEGETLKVTSSR